MMLKTRGIVFRNQKYGETSVIIDIYTEEKGLRSYIVPGVRTAKAKVSPSLVQVMSIVEFVAYDREDRSLNRIREIRPAWVYQSIPFDLKKGAIGLFMVEVARKSILEIEENKPLFEFLLSSFMYLDQTTGSVLHFHLFFLCELAKWLGFHPDGSSSAETPFFDLQEGSFLSTPPAHPHFMDPELSALFSQLIETDTEGSALLQSTRAQRRSLLHHLLDYYRLHIEHFPTINSYQVLENVMG